MRDFIEFVAALTALISLIVIPVGIVWLIWTGEVVAMQVIATAVITFIVGVGVAGVTDGLNKDED